MSLTETRAGSLDGDTGGSGSSGAGSGGSSSWTIWLAAGAAGLLVALVAGVYGFMVMVDHDQRQAQRASAGLLSGALPTDGTAVPTALVPLYNAAGQTCPQIPATLLAAQGSQESGFNPRAVSPVGAQGISQFMPGTWASWGVDGDGDGRKDPFDPADAIPAQAHYMCDLAARVQSLIEGGKVTGNLQVLTLAAYNAGLGSITKYGGLPPFAETQAYAPKILALAQSYGATLTAAPAAGGAATGDYAAVIDALAAQVGTPYSWGGGGVNGPSEGFGRGAGVIGWDCSSFIQYGYFQGTAGKVHLPRTAAAQAVALQGNAVSADALQSGDLVFYGGISTASHVAMYIGDGQMIEEPRTGLSARVTTLRSDFSLAARVPLP